MKTCFTIVAFVLVASLASGGDLFNKTQNTRPYDYDPVTKEPFQNKSGFDQSWNNNDSFHRPYRQNAYGPGIHSDATGKPFTWQTEQGQQSNGRIKTDGYGLGVGMDQYGRPVKPKQWGIE